jgi:hypothetical protein
MWSQIQGAKLVEMKTFLAETIWDGTGAAGTGLACGCEAVASLLSGKNKKDAKARINFCFHGSIVLSSPDTGKYNPWRDSKS